MTFKIYTKTGDKGETSLFSGKRVSKDNLFIEALGTVDECNSTLGIAISFLPEQKGKEIEGVKLQLIAIQHALFDLGASLATPLQSASEHKLAKTRFDQTATAQLESWIDEMVEVLPPLTTFILPSGHSSAAFLHLARSIARRAERTIYPLHKQGEISENILIYMNRLSDYLFTLARYVNHFCHYPETLWKKD